ncbi:MAG: sigma-70 family RNA polymerase sigma factor [Thermovirgaceae bacterium]|nr:sigma-70 family RNA polymerase sigma factor [Thermovirgaceae bacterium]
MPEPEYEDVLTAFRPLVEATARRYCNNGDNFEDLVQEGYLMILELLPKCRNRQFLAKFLKNRLPARVRTAARREWKVNKCEEEFDPEKHQGACCQELPFTRWAAEALLPERDCRIVRLLEAGFTQQEIAESIGLTQQAVSFRVGQMRKKMQEEDQA